jgi:hypothetical protein
MPRRLSRQSDTPAPPNAVRLQDVVFAPNEAAAERLLDAFLPAYLGTSRETDSLSVKDEVIAKLRRELLELHRGAAVLKERVAVAERLKVPKGAQGMRAIRAFVTAALPATALLSKDELATRPGETPTEKSARIRRLEQRARDETLAQAMAALVDAGDTTEAARVKLGIGHIRAQRVRTLAVRRGLLRRRQRKRNG